MTEIDYLKLKLEDKEKAFDKLHKRHMDCLKKQGELERELKELEEENEQLRQQLKEKEEDEQLYANEIVKLNKESKEVLDFKSLGGNY